MWTQQMKQHEVRVHTRAVRVGGDLLVSASGDEATHRALLSPWVSAWLGSAPCANSSSTTWQQHIGLVVKSILTHSYRYRTYRTYNYYFAISSGAEYCNHCMSVCLCSRISKTTRPNLTYFPCLLPVAITWQCNSFVNNIQPLAVYHHGCFPVSFFPYYAV